MNTIGAILKKIQDFLVALIAGQGDANSRLKDLQSQFDMARQQSEVTRLDMDARLTAADEKLTAILATLQLPADTPTALKVTLEPGNTLNTGS